MPDALTRRRKTPWTNGQTISFPEGANLFNNAHGPRQIYLLNSGQVRLTGRNGVIFDHLKKGAFFGEKSLLEAAPNQHAATALSAVEAIVLRKADLMAAWRRDPGFALRL